LCARRSRREKHERDCREYKKNRLTSMRREIRRLDTKFTLPQSPNDDIVSGRLPAIPLYTQVKFFRQPID
jgi:hypothetical protein